jgi:hypothetical protein
MPLFKFGFGLTVRYLGITYGEQVSAFFISSFGIIKDFLFPGISVPLVEDKIDEKVVDKSHPYELKPGILKTSVDSIMNGVHSNIYYFTKLSQAAPKAAGYATIENFQENS